jgi:hypothetical protein
MNHTNTVQESLGFLAKRTPFKVLIADGTPPTSVTYNYELSQPIFGISVIATLGSTSTLDISVFPVDPEGNVISSASLVTAIALTASGKIYEISSELPFRSLAIVLTSSGTVSGATIAVYG